MDTNNINQALLPNLRINLPTTTSTATTTSDHNNNIMNMNNRPPLDGPAFPPATLRRCMQAKVKIQNHDTDEPQEVQILTSMKTSVEYILNQQAAAAAAQSTHMMSSSVDDESSSDSDLSSSDFSSSEEEEDSDSEDVNTNANNEDKMEEDEDERRQNNIDGTTVNQNHHSAAPQARAPPQAAASNNNGFQMKAYMLNTKRPICQNERGGYRINICYARVLHKAQWNWTLTNEEVAIKVISWNCIRACRAQRLSEDHIKEIAALQWIGNWQKKYNTIVDHTNINGMMNGNAGDNGASRAIMLETHVLTHDVIMANDENLYIVMPYCSGDLCQRVAMSEEERLTEDESRRWFLQILMGLETLQRMRMCHRDLSPENVILLDNTSLVIDFGMCLRIPYSKDGMTYSEHGTMMHRTRRKHPCGKAPHMSPELWLAKDFDGHAIDIWAAGTILLFMLTGKRLSNPPLVDRAFDSINLGISHEATDLLRKMFRLDPNNRLTLEQIRNHPFVNHREFLAQR